MLQVCLAVGESSRLRKRLVLEEEVAVSVSISWGWRIDPGVFLAYAELAPGARPGEAEAVLWEELERVRRSGVSTREVERARACSCSSSLLHDLSTHHGVAHSLGQSEALLGDFREAGRALEHYQQVTPVDVRRVAREFLDPAARCVVSLEPEGAAGRRRARTGEGRR